MTFPCCVFSFHYLLYLFFGILLLLQITSIVRKNFHNANGAIPVNIHHGITNPRGEIDLRLSKVIEGEILLKVLF